MTLWIASLTNEEMEATLKSAKQDYRKAKKTDIEERLKFLETFDPKIRNRLLRTEEQRHKGRVATRITQKLQGGSVSKVIDTDSYGNPFECTTQEAIETAVAACGQNKYSQTNETPFMTPPLQPLFGYAADTPAVEAVLDGTSPPQVPIYTPVRCSSK